METFAVYWEPIIKTYGIAERTGLCLLSMDIALDRLSAEEDSLSQIASRFDGSLVLIFSRPSLPSGLCLNLLLDLTPEKNNVDAIKNKIQPAQLMDINIAPFNKFCSGLQVDNPVELVYFQGPHYGDRYGIADAALTALAKHDVRLLAVVCAGASVYLITPKGMASAATNALREAFSTPGTVTSQSNL